MVNIILQIVGFLLIILAGFILGIIIANQYWKIKLPKLIKKERENAVKKSREVLSGQFSEQLAPFLPDFKYSPSEARFIGKPVDFIVFKGMDQKDINEIVFVEVKSGSSTLSMQEKKLSEIVKDKKIKWEEYRIPEGLVKKIKKP